MPCYIYIYIYMQETCTEICTISSIKTLIHRTKRCLCNNNWYSTTNSQNTVLVQGNYCSDVQRPGSQGYCSFATTLPKFRNYVSRHFKGCIRTRYQILFVCFNNDWEERFCYFSSFVTFLTIQRALYNEGSKTYFVKSST